MAKNFDQLAGDDNPITSYLKKAEQEEKQNKDAAAILSSLTGGESTAAASSSSKNNEKTEASEPQTSATEVSESSKKILMNINLRESTKKQWKMFFLDHDLTMTQGIETAVEYLMSEVNKGNIRLTKGGITK